MIKITLLLDRVELSASVHLGATLAEFLEAAGGPDAEALLLLGEDRLLSPKYELACRFIGANLASQVGLDLEETPALTIEELLALSV